MEGRRPRTRIFSLAWIILLGLGAVVGRLVQLQIVQYSEYLARARRQQQRIVEVSPARGVMYDRNLHELAMSIPEDSCFAVPAEISDPSLVARLLSGILEMDPEEIETRLTGSKSFVWIARKLPADKVERIQALNLRGIYFQKESQRFYPKGDLAAHALGYVDIDGRGLGGVEYQYDDRLRGKPVQMLVMADARRRWYERHGPDAGQAASLVLTLDVNIQYIAEKALKAAIAQTQAKAGVIVVQDPSTGELLAVANWPNFDPNAAGAAAPETRMDRAVSALYEPGSTFKIVTVAAALNEGITNPDEVIDCQMGSIVIANHLIHDHKPFGLLTVTKVIAESSDVGAIKLGLRLGPQKFYDYIRAFGFGSPTGVELPGESRGLLRRLENWSAISIGGVSMGQEVGVTPLQLATAVSAIANGGVLHRPRMVREVRSCAAKGADCAAAPASPEAGAAGESGGSQFSVSADDSARRVVRPETAAMLRKMLEEVVLSGTGKLARLDGYTVAGKTGTAQKIDPATGRYSTRDYIASFVGFAPVNSPAVTVLVVLDSPVGGHMGGSVAAPVFRDVTQQTLSYLRVPPDIPVAPPVELAAARRPGAAGAEDLSDFDSNQLLDPNAQRTDVPPALPAEPGLPRPSTGGRGARAAATTVRAGGENLPGRLAKPPAGRSGSQAEAPLPVETTVVLDESNGVEVPSFEGRTMRAFVAECLRLGLSPVPVGAGVAVEQSPPSGTRVRAGSRIVVRFAASAGVPAISPNRN
ncbi:MAG TPA: penicillin-binding transpeptidase domain-containing protein [Candidatus Acidoferrales bacterium]|nr:penicillin-binding transpeptidase domain-containing protein [Candidatus Acidoferrales bacterium]